MSYPPTAPQYDPAIPSSRSHQYSQPRSGPTPFQSSPSSPSVSRRPFTSRSDSRKPLLEELLPTPRYSEIQNERDSLAVLRRTGSLAVISIFLLSVVFLAVTEGKRKLDNQSLRNIFGAGIQAEVGNSWLGQDLDKVDGDGDGDGAAATDKPSWQGAQPGHGMSPSPDLDPKPKHGRLLPEPHMWL